MTRHKPTDDNDVRRRGSRRRLPRSRRLTSVIVVALLVGGIAALWMWSPLDLVFVLIILFVPVLLLIESPVAAFGTLAAIIFALGSYLRWPPLMARLSPTRRGLVLLAVVFVLHGIWFQFGWVPFRPPCTTGGGPLSMGGDYSLVGPMTPEVALEFVDTLNWRDRDVARLSGPNAVVARPAMVLFDDGGVWNNTNKLAERLAEEQGLPPPDFDRRDQCAEVARILMVGGKAESLARGWGTWPWNTFDEWGAAVQWLRRVAQ